MITEKKAMPQALPETVVVAFLAALLAGGDQDDSTDYEHVRRARRLLSIAAE